MKNTIILFTDASFGKLSLLYNLLKYLGWHPMNTFYDLIGDIVEKKLGCKDATFLDVSIFKFLKLKIEDFDYHRSPFGDYHLRQTPRIKGHIY